MEADLIETEVLLIGAGIAGFVRFFIKMCQNTPQLCWGMNGLPSPLGGEG